MGPLEIFVEVLGPRAFLDRAKALLACPEDDLESQEALFAMLEDFNAMIKQDKHKTATYITEELVKTLIEILQRFSPYKNLDDDAESVDNDEKETKSPRGQKSGHSKPWTPKKADSKAKKPKRTHERRNGNDSDEETDADDQDASESGTLVVNSSRKRQNGSSSSLSNPKSPKSDSSRSLTSPRSPGKNPPKRSPSKSSKSHRKAKDSSESDSSSSFSDSAEDESSDGETERCAEELRLATEERSRKFREIRIKIRKLVIQTFTNAAEADISLIRKLISARFISRVRKLFSSRSFDEESLVALMNGLKPFFIVRAHQKSLVEGGILAALIKFVSRPAKQVGGSALQYAAVDLLLYFDESYQRELLNAGVLSAALRLLANGTPQIRTRALELLFFFSKNYQEDMINEGIISQIISLLNLAEQTNASNKQVLSGLLLRSLTAVSRFDKSYHADLIAAGIFPRLISLLSIKDEKLQRSCCDILASFEENYLPQMIENKYLEAVLSLMDLNCAASYGIASWAFRKVADFCDRESTLPQIVKAGVVETLVQKVIGAPVLTTGTEIRAVGFLLLHELPITFEKVESAGLFQIIPQFLTWEPKFLDIHTYYPESSLSWAFQRSGILKEPASAVQTLGIGLFKLSVSSLINFVEIDPENCKFESLNAAFDASLALLPTRTAASDPGNAKERLLFEFLLASTRVSGAKKYLLEEKSLLSSFLDFVVRVKDTDALSWLKKIPDSREILQGSAVLVKLIEFLSEDALAQAALDLLHLVDRESLAQHSVVETLATKALGREGLKAAFGLGILDILVDIAPICAPEVASLLVGPLAMSQFLKFTTAHKLEVSKQSLRYLETLSRSVSGIAITEDLVKFLLAQVKESASDIAHPTSSSQSSGSFSFSIPQNRGLDSSNSLSKSRDRSVSSQSTVIGTQRAPRLTLGSARGRAGSTPQSDVAPPLSPTSSSVSFSSSSSSSTPVVVVEPVSKQQEEDFDRGCSPLRLLLRLICTQGRTLTSAFESESIAALLRHKSPAETTPIVFQFLGSKEHQSILTSFFHLFEYGPRLSKQIRDFLVDLVALCPADHQPQFISAAIVENIVIPFSKFISSTPMVEDFCILLLNAIRRFGALAWSELLKFTTNIEAFQKLLLFPNARVRSLLCDIFLVDMGLSTQGTIIDTGLLQHLVDGLRSEIKLWRETRPSGVSNTEELLALHRPLVSLVSKLEDKHFFVQTHLTNTQATPVAPATAGASSQAKDSELPVRYKIINYWLNHTYSWRVQYQATRDGWAPESFYARSKECGPNLVIVQTTDGSSFGAYTSQSWNPSNGGRPYPADASAFLFTLESNRAGTPADTKLAIKSEKVAQAIYASYSGVGPTYGEGHDFVVDLRAKALRGVLGYSFSAPKGVTAMPPNFWGTSPLREVTLYTINSASSVPAAPAPPQASRPEKRFHLLNKSFSTIVNNFSNGVREETEQLADDLDDAAEPDGESTFAENEPVWELVHKSSASTDWSQFLSTPSNGPLGSLFLVRTQDGAVFGGYSGLERSKSLINTFKEDPKSFLFSLKPPKGTSRYPTALGLKKPASPSVMFLSDGIAFGEGFDLRINFANPGKSFSNLGVSYEASGEQFSPQALNFFAGQPANWNVATIEVYGLMSNADKAAFASTQRVYGNLRLLFRLLSAYSVADAKPLFETVDAKLTAITNSQRKKTLAEMQRFIMDASESTEVRDILKPRLVSAKLPNLKIAPYKVLSVGGKGWLSSPKSDSDGAEPWRKDYSISRPIYVESPGNILLEFDTEAAVPHARFDSEGQPPFLTHFLVGVDILGGDIIMNTVPAKRVLIFASDSPIDEAQLERFDKPHVAMGHDPDDVKAADELLALQELEEQMEREQEALMAHLKSTDYAITIESDPAGGAAAAGEEDFDPRSTVSISATESEISTEASSQDAGAALDDLFAKFDFDEDETDDLDMRIDLFAQQKEAEDAEASLRKPRENQKLHLPVFAQPERTSPAKPVEPVARALSRSFRTGSRGLRMSGRGEKGQLLPIASLMFGDWSYDEIAVKVPCNAKYLLIKVLADPTRRDNINGTICISAFAAVAYAPVNPIPPIWPYPSQDAQQASSIRRFLGPSSIPHEKSFLYESDFDQNGLIWWLGTQMGASTVWENPATTGKVQVKVSHTLFNASTMKAADVLGTYQEPVACFWGGSAPTYCVIDLGIVTLNVSHYTLRHGYNYSNSFMQDFVLEGSHDAENWEPVHEQLKTPFATAHAKASFSVLHSPTCTGVGKFFRYYRIFQKGNYFMGTTSNQKTAPFLCINGVEFYGVVRFDENVLSEPPLFSERNAQLKIVQSQSQSQTKSEDKGKEKDE